MKDVVFSLNRLEAVAAAFSLFLMSPSGSADEKYLRIIYRIFPDASVDRTHIFSLFSGNSELYDGLHHRAIHELTEDMHERH
jgi:hypothetical protein